MARLRDLRGTQKYKEPSSCLGPFGDPGQSVGEVESGRRRRWITTQSVVGVHRGLKARRKVLEEGYDQRVGWLLEARAGGARRPARRRNHRFLRVCSVRFIWWWHFGPYW